MTNIYLAVIAVVFTAAIQGYTFDEELQVVTEEAYPMNYMDSSGIEITGLATEYLRDVLTKNKIRHSFNLMPWTRAFKTASEQPNVLIYSIARTQNREHAFHWLYEIVALEYYLYGLSERAAELNTIEEIKSAKIAVVYNDVTHRNLSDKGFTNLVLAQNYQQLNALLQKHRVDYIASSTLGIKYFRERFNLDMDNLFEKEKISGLDVSLYYALSKQSAPALANHLKALLSSNIHEKSYQALKSM